jgi:hypothetical protein
MLLPGTRKIRMPCRSDKLAWQHSSRNQDDSSRVSRQPNHGSVINPFCSSFSMLFSGGIWHSRGALE